MGFKRERRQYRLRFESDEYAGFVCLMGSLTVDEFIESTASALRLQTEDSKPEDVAGLFTAMAEKIIEWNLENEDGSPVPTAYAACVVSGKHGMPGFPCSEHNTGEEGQEPCEYDGLCKQDFDFVMDIQVAWMSAIASVSSPLPKGLNNGGITPEAITASLASSSRSLPN